MVNRDDFQRYLDLGVAFTNLTRSKAEELVSELVQNGEFQTGDARAKVDELLERSRKSREALLTQVRKEVAHQLDAVGITNLEDLAEQVAVLIGRSAAAGKAATAKTKEAAKKSAAAKKSPAKTATAKKAPAAKKATTATKTTKKSTTAKQTAAKTATAKQTAAKQTAAKKTPAKKSPAKKASAAKKSPARKATARPAVASDPTPPTSTGSVG